MGFLLIDFSKAFDKIDRTKLFKLLWNKAKDDKERSMFKLIYKMFANTEFEYKGIRKK